MKNKYFGDKRDYFKYDLMIFLAHTLPDIQRFTFIPMLTANDGSGDGGKTNYAPEGGNCELHQFLQSCIKGERRNIRQLRTFFMRHHFRFEYCPYSDDMYFIHHQRGPYFARIPDNSLNRAVVLADPDNGLEVKSMIPSAGHRYIRYEEVRSLYFRMDATSVLVVFQYFPRYLPRIKRKPYLMDRFCELVSRLQCPHPLAISDNVIAFLILTKSHSRRLEVLRLLKAFERRNGRYWVFSDATNPKVAVL